MTSEQINEAIERLRELGGDGRLTSSNIIDAVFSGNTYKVRDTLIDILKRANPDTHMELPVDADGEPIHVGDELCGYGYTKGGVYCKAIINGWGVAVGTPIDTDTSGWRLWNVSDIHHYHKPTIEDVLREMIDKAGCRHYDDGSCEMGLSNEQIADYARRISEVMADE